MPITAVARALVHRSRPPHAPIRTVAASCMRPLTVKAIQASTARTPHAFTLYRPFTSTSPSLAHKTSRSSSNYTFSTKYPRAPKKQGATQLKRSSKTKKSVKSMNGDLSRRLAARVPERLRLAHPKTNDSMHVQKKGMKKLQSGSTRMTTKTKSTTDRTTTSKTKTFDRTTSKTKSTSSRPRTISKELQSKIQQSRHDHTTKFMLEQTTSTASNTNDNTIRTIKSSRFDKMGLHPLVLDGIRNGLGYTKPTPVQALAIPSAVDTDMHVIGSQSVPVGGILCAAETGSGKTAAYLAALMHHLKLEEDELMESVTRDIDSSSSPFQVVEAITASGFVVSPSKGLGVVRKLYRPRALVIVPSRDLVGQITAMAKSMAHHAKLRVLGVHAKTPARAVKSAFAEAPVDVLIGTPGAILDLIETKTIALSQTRHVAIDEADTLFDTNFKDEIMPIVASVRDFAVHLNRSCHFVMTTATLPRTLVRTLKSVFTPENGTNVDTSDQDALLPVTIKQIVTPMLHRTSRKLKQVFLKIDGSTTKPNMLLEVLKQTVIHHSTDKQPHATDDTTEANANDVQTKDVNGARVLVFCNRSAQCVQVGEFLRSKGYDEVCVLTSMTETAERSAALSKILDPIVVKSKHDVQTPSSSSSQPFIIVATDMASRGLDTTRIDHVVLYDFPQTSIDYLHRVGRAGRNNTAGRSTSFVTRKDTYLADVIQRAVKLSQPLA